MTPSEKRDRSLMIAAYLYGKQGYVIIPVLKCYPYTKGQRLREVFGQQLPPGGWLEVKGAASKVQIWAQWELIHAFDSSVPSAAFTRDTLFGELRKFLSYRCVFVPAKDPQWPPPP